MKKILVVFTSLILLTGCLGKKGPEGAVREYLENCRNVITEKLEEAIGENNGSPLDYLATEVNKVKDFEYVIDNIEENDDKAIATVTVKTYNFGLAMSEFIKEYFSKALALAMSGETSEDELNKLASDILIEKFKEKLDAGKEYEGQLELNLSLVDGKWSIDESNDENATLDCLLGGLGSAINDLANSLN